jgi:hypothetical protein
VSKLIPPVKVLVPEIVSVPDFVTTLDHSVVEGSLYPLAIEIVLVPLVVIAEVEEEDKPVPVLIITDVTVPVLAVAPVAIPSNLVLSAELIKPFADVVAAEYVVSVQGTFTYRPPLVPSTATL